MYKTSVLKLVAPGEQFLTVDEASILKEAVENNIINIAYLQEQMQVKKNKEILSKHKYSITHGKDGKW